MKAEIISIGSELLLGQTLNTNQYYLSQKLAEIGIDLFYHTTVGDNRKRLSETFKKALKRSDIVITTGGLGPTVDDITMETAASVLGRDLVISKTINNTMSRYFRTRGIDCVPKDARKQAFVPTGAVLFKNSVGTAPGIFLKSDNSILILLPGPPGELCPMFVNSLIPYLKKQGYYTGCKIETKTIRITGLPESRVNEAVKDLLCMSGDTMMGIYAKTDGVDLKITTKAKSAGIRKKNILSVTKKVKDILGEYIYGEDNDTLESILIKELIHKKNTIAVAESCSGGLISSRLTDVPGSSDCFLMGITAYSNRAKENELGISSKDIRIHGAVSSIVAKDMAKNIRKISGSDIGVSVTGIAGPSGGTDKKPVGLVFIAVSSPARTVVKKCLFSGNRSEVKYRSASKAMSLVLSILKV